MTTLRSLRARFLAPALGVTLATVAVASFGGCFVSFDGYELADAGGSDGELGGAGAANGGTSGGQPTGGGHAGMAAHGGAGAANDAGSTSLAGTSPLGGSSNGGASGGPTAGSSSGGAGNAGAANGGSGGTISSGGGGAGGGAQGGGGASAGNGGSGGGNPLSCPVPLHGAILVEIPKPGGGIYCIDRTEVTNQDYQAFLASKPNPSAQTGACSGNADFTPASDPTNCTQYDPTNKPKVPVACVDWCDAQAYCAWAGKRLCGKIGGGTNATADFADATKSEWFAACSKGGALKFPYGNTYQSDACIGADNTAVRPTAVPTANCQGGYDGLFDMSGNVSEWEDSCSGNTGLSDQCLYRGGSYLDLDTTTTPTLTCNSGATSAKAAAKARSTRDKEIGFRCCLDP